MNWWACRSISRCIPHNSTKPLRNSPFSAFSIGGFARRTATEELSGRTSCFTRRPGSRWSSSGYTSRGMCLAGRSIPRSSFPRACFCWARRVSGGSAATPCGPAPRAGLVLRLLAFLGFGPAGPLRGSDTRSSLGAHPLLLLCPDGFPRARRAPGRRRRVSEHAAQFRHLRFNLLKVLLVTYQRSFQGRFVKRSEEHTSELQSL